jgi:hypothetical protein
LVFTFIMYLDTFSMCLDTVISMSPVTYIMSSELILVPYFTHIWPPSWKTAAVKICVRYVNCLCPLKLSNWDIDSECVYQSFFIRKYMCGIKQLVVSIDCVHWLGRPAIYKDNTLKLYFYHVSFNIYGHLTNIWQTFWKNDDISPPCLNYDDNAKTGYYSH